MKKILILLILSLPICAVSQMIHEIDTSNTETSSSLQEADIFTYEIPNNSVGYLDILIIAKDYQDSVIIEKRYATWAGYSIVEQAIITAISSVDNSGYAISLEIQDSILVVAVTAPTLEKSMSWYLLSNIYYNNGIVTAPNTPPSGNNTLNLSDDNNEYLQRIGDVVLSGEFNINVTAQELVQNGTYIPLFGGSTTANRVLITQSGTVAVNIAGSALVIKTVPGMDVSLINTYSFFRDSLNDVYFQVDAETPVFITNNSGNFTLRYIGKASSTFKITGIVHGFTINSDVFDLSEGQGDTLTADNSASKWLIKSDLGLTHINENVWFVAPPESASIKVINAGVGGNNAEDMDNRFDSDVTPHDPDMVFICAGTNDAINSFHNLTPSVFKSKLTSIVQKTLAIGAIPVIWNIPPVIDSYCKDDHDYTSIYGNESGYDLNDILDSLFRSKVDEVVSENTGCLLFDVKDLITDYSLNQTGMLKNEANTVTGNTDGVHFTGTEANTINNGRLIVANGMVSLCSGMTKIVLLGDSNMAMGGATTIANYLSLALNQ